ncbi:AzlD domain-containing protein [Sulfobacillus sp. hq2]|uniref:Branched-chain amino acid ABC transporter n=1 Tax=Sulfobacillus thermotolerans TaxID=338644 RepID=A0ABM6RRC8_9FIRM|nr:AzlD domain-containing protein [Sulfobacillus sp. hq2]AUW93962.1 hypothetical protein BXT84_08380 [Sulfobacillus thermotolerans]MCY0907667.1 AzlD domain-containing protein [Sulfobacillus thermotolerans]POB11934.1 hypothetical protein CO251_02190 [Sulfobacillus sp. hq2]
MTLAVVVTLAALGTWAERVVPWLWAIRAHAQQSPVLRSLDAFVRAFAPAVVMALLLSALWAFPMRSLMGAVPIAMAMTVIFAWRFRSLALSIVAGMGAFWLVHVL